MADEGKAKPDEQTAIEWPPADYREWVQTSVTNRMIGRLAAGGITLISLAAGTLFWLQDSSAKNIQIDTQAKLNELELQMRTQIDNRIDTRIEGKMTNDPQLMTNLFTAVKIEIEKYIETDEYRERVRTAIIQDRTLEDLIRERGIAIAQNTDSPVATRKLGIQLYGLFQSEDVAGQEGFRSELVSILEKERRFSELSSAVLDLYKFRDCPDFAFATSDNTCKSNDRRAVQAAIALYGAATDERSMEAIASWLATIPPTPSYIVANALAREASNAEPLLRALAGSGRADLIEAVATELVERSEASETSAGDNILALLARLPSDLPLSRQARIDLARWLWDHATPAELEAAFASAGIAGDAIDTTSDRPALLQAAFVKLLRTGGPAPTADDHDGRLGDNDWDSLLTHALELGADDGRDALLLNAWAARIDIDHGQGLDVRWAGRRMLRHYVEIDKSGTALPAYASVVEVAAWPDVGDFADAYLTRVETLGADDPILQAILDQDRLNQPAHGKASFHWLRRALENHLERADELMSAALHQDAGMTFSPSTHHWHLALSRAAGMSPEAPKDPRDDAFAAICRQEVTRRLTSIDDATRWPMVTVVESLLLAEHSDSDAPLRAEFTAALPWLAAPPASTVLAIASEPLSWPIAEGAGRPELPSLGGIWQRVAAEADYWVTYRPPGGVALAAFDGVMGRFLGSSEPGAPLELHLQPAQEYLVVARPLTRGGKPEPVAVESRAFVPRLSPNTRDTALPLDATTQRLEFMSGEASGEAWLRTRVPAGHRIAIETGALPHNPANHDTVVYLIDATTGEELDRNDDVRGSGHSYALLRHTAWRETEAMIRIGQWGEQPFPPGTHFHVEVDVVKAEPLRVADLPTRLHFAATEEDREGLYRVTLTAGQTISVVTSGLPESPANLDTVVHLLDPTTGEILGTNDDGPDLGLFSNLIYTATRNGDFVIHVVQIGDEAFAAGTEFAIDVSL